MVTCLVHWEGRDLETMMASDVTIISTSLIVGISLSIAGSLGGGGGGGGSDMSLYSLCKFEKFYEDRLGTL